MEKLTYKNKVKELITILMESPFYVEVPLVERHLLIKKIIEEYRFLTKNKDKEVMFKCEKRWLIEKSEGII